ncbi:MAG TPA: peptidylprolyl isomerase [Alphaproteobacteria bacterium]|nr:peptidylprolyl isomerase [Alphaproteobacteria bacterium]
MKAFFLAILTLAAACCGAPAEAQQDLQRIAAVVNDQVVSMFDLAGRIRLTIVSSGLEDSPEIRTRLAPQILRTLIDEALEVQEAKRLNITVNSAEIEQAMARIAKQNDMTDTQFSNFLKQSGIPLSTLVAQIRAGLSWSKIVAEKIRPSIEIGDDQVQEYLDRLKASKDKPEYRLQEIFLAVDTPQQEDDVRRTAERLSEQIKRGANFTAVARQFSQSATAAVGGDLGWVEEGALEPEIQRAVDQLKVGEISAPIRTVSGFHLILLREKRQSGAAAADTSTLKIEHLFIPGPPNATPEDLTALRSLAQTVSDNAASCPDFASLRKQLPDAKTVIPETVTANDLAPAIRAVASKLAVGKASEPITLNNGVFVMMICSREGASEGGLPGAEDVRNRLGQEKLDLLTRRYLRDMRTAAFIDLRS